MTEQVPGNVSGGAAAERGYVVAHLPGDGVGPEVTEVARRCVDAVAKHRGFTCAPSWTST